MKKRKGIKIDDRERWIRDWQKNWDNGIYAPFIRTEDVPSSGTKHRCRGVHSNRVHHLLSTNEYYFFIYLESQPDVLEINEQFPMLPLSLTRNVANALNIKHPRYPGTSTDMVMTTDFLVRLKNGDLRAYSIKPSDALRNDRVIKKQAIEKGYWELQGVQWEIILDDQLKTTFSRNLSMLRSFANLPNEYSAIANKWADAFDLIVHTNKYERLSVTVNELSNIFDIDYKASSSILFYCLWHKTIKSNLNVTVRLEKTPFDLGIAK
ncbi:TnsA endonuclease N-terminal domain-containing protein [uncultured Marinobacter sp.]|uniref:TnsA endonuclease N-terminal domain-containing protein n=1 Tax=uncultured Marinobacter sp. TaxID=187379 RepID=UPI0026349FE3|nr:TnsA endonuclease N-terminal domain-containing protein [uncultured Marinobacter sp.]